MLATLPVCLFICVRESSWSAGRLEREANCAMCAGVVPADGARPAVSGPSAVRGYPLRV